MGVDTGVAIDVDVGVGVTAGVGLGVGAGRVVGVVAGLGVFVAGATTARSVARGDGFAVAGVGGAAVTIAAGSFAPRWPSIESAAPMMNPATTTPIRIGINGNDGPSKFGWRARRGLSSIDASVSAYATSGPAK
jgi:hypothetical protein